MCVADVYKKYIMTDVVEAERDRGIEVFQNNNILKYTTKNVVSISDPPLLSKNSSF